MRDALLALLLFGSVPVILRYTWVGVLVWSWLSYMNPHRLAYGFAYSFDWTELIAVTTLISVFFSTEKKKIPWTSVTTLWLVFIAWTSLTTLFALNSASAMTEWDRFIKTSLLMVMTLICIRTRKQLTWLIWVIAASIGFYGVKGGIFTIMTGGGFLVLGPPSSFISGNNEVAFALIIILPLMRYLQVQSESRWIRLGMMGVMGLSAAAIAGSHSRGALVAGSAMVFMLWWRGRRKVLFGTVMVVGLIALLLFMPPAWFERMASIKDYKEDGSAMGRMNAWAFAYNLAADRPIVGGGFRTFTPSLFLVYAPSPTNFHDAHSIYFEVLGEHGFIGLGLFLWLGLSTFLAPQRIRRETSKRPDLVWAYDLAGMIQVCMIGYAVGGVFLGLAYFDLYYHLIAMVLITQAIVVQSLVAETSPGGRAEGVKSWLGP
jgi:probable O-glycosylation ligase (exosortase A-associated)